MTIQNFSIYTQKGYAGDLVDSGPRVIQSGIIEDDTSSTLVPYGIAMQRGTAGKQVLSGSAEIATSSTTNVYSIAQREYNREAGTRPSDGTDFGYREFDTASLIREGYLYVKTVGAPTVAGEAMIVDEATGQFLGSSPANTAIAGQSVALNVFADETVIAGEVCKVRIDIVSA